MSTDHKSNNPKFGEYIRNARLKLNIGLREFAKQVGVSAAYISKMEIGDEIPKEENIKKIAKILKLDEDKLFSLADKISSDIKNIINTEPDLYASFLRRVKSKDIKRFMNEINNGEKQN